jgi:Mce-associated membrane protein
MTDDKLEPAAESGEVEPADIEPTAVELDKSAAGEGDLVGATESGTAAEESETRSPSMYKRVLVPALLGVLLVASAAFASWIYFSEHRPDSQTSERVAADVLKAASEGTVALLSYSPESLDKDFANAKSYLTGDFLNYYTQFTNDIVTPAAKQKNVKTTAQIARSSDKDAAAVSQLRPDSAEVLLFINQNTTSKENPDGAFAASSVKVGLTKVDGRWLISTFDPV